MKRRAKIILSLMMILLALSWAKIVWAAVTVSTDAMTIGTARPNQRKIVRDSLGNLYFAYLKGAGGFRQIFVAQSTDEGQTWSDMGGSSVQVIPGCHQESPSLAIDSRDRLHLVWTGRHNSDIDWGEEWGQIKYSRYDGISWSEWINIAEGFLANYPQGYPSLAIDSRDRLHLVWTGRDAANPGHSQIKYAKSVNNGASWRGWVNITGADLSGHHQEPPSLALDSSDRLHLLWAGRDADSPDCNQIKYSRYDGISWSNWLNITANDLPNYTQSDPSIAIDSRDQLHVVWIGKDPGNATYQIKYAKYDGAFWSAWENITGESLSNYHQGYPSLAIDGSNRLHVLWSGYDANQGTDHNIKYSKRGASGWSNWKNRTNSSIHQRYPILRWSKQNVNGGYLDWGWCDGERITFDRDTNISLTPDETEPTIIITSPQDGSVTTQDVTILYTVSDDGTPPEEIVVTDDQGNLPPFIYTADGVYDITLTATDLANNRSTDSVSFIIDKTPPPAITDLMASTGIAGETVDLTWTASGDAPSGVDAYIVRYNTEPITESVPWVQTTRADFESGSSENVDIVSRPGDVKLAGGEYSVDDSTVGLWHFNEGSGRIVGDETPNNNQGTISSATWVDGKFDKALYFDGNNDYVNVSNESNFDVGTGDFTWEAWVKVNDFNSLYSILTKASTTMPYPGRVLAVTTTGSIWARIQTDYNNYIMKSSDIQITQGEWHHVSFLRSGTSVKLFIDGREDTALWTTVGDGASSNPDNDISVRIGIKGQGLEQPFNGTIDEVRISNVARREFNVGYSLSGILTSSVYDAHSITDWGETRWDSTEPTGTSIVIETRTSADEVTWSSWEEQTNGAVITSPTNKYIQYRAILAATDPIITPVLHEVTIAGGNWDTSTLVTVGVPTPSPAGAQESMTITDLTPGEIYYFALKTRDKAGSLSAISNIASAAAQADTIPPVIVITFPPDGYITSEDVTLSYLVSDNISAVDDILVTGDDSPYTAEGLYHVTITAIDGVGNTSSASVSFIIDKRPPEIDIVSPVDGLITSRDVGLEYTVTDNLTEVTITGPENGTVYSEEGGYTIEISATDQAGNTSSTTISFLIDKAPPVITISSPTYGLITNQDVTLVYTVSDNVSEPGNITVTGDVSPYPTEGLHTVTLTATDQVGNTSSATVSFLIDKTTPVISITSPEDGLITNEDVTLTYTVTDNLTEVTVTGPESGTVYSEEDNYILTVSAEDQAVNTSSESISFSIDKTPPTTTISYGYHEGTTLIPESQFTLTAEDSGGSPPSGVQYTKYCLDHEEWLTYFQPFTIADYAYRYHSEEAETWMLSNHTVTYYSVDNVENAEEVKSLSITVSPALEVSKDLALRTLVWLNYSEEELLTIDRNAIQEALNKAQSRYSRIVTTEIEFIKGLRSNRYSTYVILGDHSYCEGNEYECLSKGVRDELREQVCLGRGLITSLWHKIDNVTPPRDKQGSGGASGSEVLGVWFKGNLPDEDYSIEILPTIGNPQGYSFISTGGALKVGILEPDQPPENEGEVLGYIDGDPDLPALVTNAFGRGRTAYFAFDVAKSMGIEAVANLFSEALMWVAPKEGDPSLALGSGGEVAIQITLQAQVVDLPGLVLEDILPEDAEVISTSDAGTISGNQITWYLNLFTSKPTILTYLVRLPSLTAYTATTRAEYLVRGIYYTHPPFDRVTLTFQILEPEEVKAEILSALDALEVSGGDAAQVKQTYRLISNLPDLSLELGPEELDKAIQDILKAIKTLDKVTSIDYETYILPIRYRLDQLMLIYETYWADRI